MEKKTKSERKPSEVTIERVNSQGKKMKFRVIDNATRLHPKVCCALSFIYVGQHEPMTDGFTRHTTPAAVKSVFFLASALTNC